MQAPVHPDGYPEHVVSGVLDDILTLPPGAVYGIVGLQGSGKSTLAAQVAALARARGRRAAVLSVDDVYLDRDARERLGREVHPLLATRGPPGTHDLALALDTLDALRAGRPAPLPQFDKLADRRLPASQWPRAEGADLVLFEGWFLKTPPQAEAELAAPLNALEREEDRDGRWRRYCNRVLGRDYPPLWARIDRLLFLQGPGFEVVPEWRWQQEQALQAARPERAAMSRAQVERFVQFFERTSRQALRALPEIADRVLRLDGGRRIVP
ncbi:kinase [Luteimonas aquatica]|uniref:kinase n=1 Tax=Luteimonas aquatica TaxID=450364 RepID=UPI001F57972D|nr:kinase [Luteimonas aquatica]